MKVIPSYLKAVPKIRQDYIVENQRVVLLIARKGIVDKIICWLFNKPKVGRIPFDEMSTKAFLLIDNQRTLEDIAQELLRDEIKEETLESMQVRVAQFLSYLHHRKFISLS